jgi:hypothetical protein
MKVFSYAIPPLNGRQLVGWAYILDGPYARFLHGADAWTENSVYHIVPMTIVSGDAIVTERMVLLRPGQSSEGLPGWRPADAL